MNMYDSAVPTPSLFRIGATITAAMMNDAVTGTASPRMSTAAPASTTVTTSWLVLFQDIRSAKPSTTSDRLNPRPVRVVTPVITPAAPQVAATGSTAREPWASASNARFGRNAFLRSRKDSANASTVAYDTARNGVMSRAMNATMATSELKW